MAQVTRLTSEQRANLVAYLDGELAEEETVTMERLLASSDVARHEVEALDRAWSLLDTLPRESASAEFATNTLARIKGQTAPRTYANVLRPVLLSVGWVSTLLAAGLIGFAIGERWLPREEDPYLDKLSVLERLDQYQSVGDVEFMNELERRQLLEAPRTESNVGDRR